MKITKAKKGTVKPMRPFKTLEKEVRFWDTHDVVDNITSKTVVGFHKTNKKGILTIRFDEKDLQTLREAAYKKGVGPTTLARMWVKERLLTR